MFLAYFVDHSNSWINLEATTHYPKLHVDELTLKGHKCDQTRHHRHQNSSIGADETTGNEERDILLIGNETNHLPSKSHWRWS